MVAGRGRENLTGWERPRDLQTVTKLCPSGLCKLLNCVPPPPLPSSFRGDVLPPHEPRLEVREQPLGDGLDGRPVRGPAAREPLEQRLGGLEMRILILRKFCFFFCKLLFL